MAQDYYFSSQVPNHNNNNDNTQQEIQKPVRRKEQPTPPQHKVVLTTEKTGKGKKTNGRGKRPPASSNKSKGTIAFLKVLIGFAIICAFTFVVVSMTVLVYSINYVNGDTVVDLDTEQFNSAQTTFIYGTDSKGKEIEIATLHGTENRVWVDVKDMNQYLPKAFIAIEDKRFEDHHGVDWVRTIGAAVKYTGTQGGSTITQQLIKNVTNQDQVTIVRKFNEILTALNLEKSHDKEQIIEAYMNTIYLSHGCYGVQTAAEKYFGKEVKDLNVAECATIAAITQWPNRYDPLVHPDKNKKRQEKCLKNMLKEKMITKQEYDEALAYKLVFTNSEDYQGSTVKKDDSKIDKSKVQSYYVDFVIDSVISDLKAQGIPASKAKKMIYGGGLKIYSAIDFDVQEAMEDVYVNYRRMPDETVQSAMTIMEYDGRVVGIVGGTGKKTANRVLNRASKSPRQPGSTMKPIGVYAPAIDVNAVYWSKMIKDAPSRNEDNPAKPGNDWPTNQGDVYSGENVTVQRAVAKSMNTVPVRILTDIGFDTSVNYLTEKFHLTNLVKEGEKNDVDYSPLALGGMTRGATTLEMTAAYQAFGNGGKYYKPYCYYKVINSKNEIILEKEDNGEQAISPATATIMNRLLCSVVTGEGGTGASYALNPKYEMFAKTGTTTGSNDRWFVAGTPYYVGSVWYGYDTPKEIHYSISANPCGTIWNLVMSNIHSKKGLDGAKFELSSDAVQRKYCTHTGLLASKNCDSTATGWYAANHLPAYCNGKHGGSSGGDKPTTGSSQATSVPSENTTAGGSSENTTTPTQISED